MKFCCQCGSAMEQKIPEGDNRERACCPSCGFIHYINPRVVVGTVTTYKDQILLCKRAIEPRYGFWTLPAGFMEINETTHAGALRETWEEAKATPELGPLFTIFDVIPAEQVHMFYRAELLEPVFDSGPESLDVQLFDEKDIPWDELAFKTVSLTLKLFLEDRTKGRFGLHTGDVFNHIDWPDSAFTR